MSQPVVFRARFVFPVCAPPISGGYVSIAGGRVAAVDGSRPDGPVDDLGSVAILPGLVNAHTHLEFSNLTSPLGTPGNDIAQWICSVVEHRRKRTVADASDAPADGRRDALSAGLAECLSYGTTSLGEIRCKDAPTNDGEVYAGRPANVVVFQELLGLSLDRTDELLALARRHLEATGEQRGAKRRGLSPHAPYTVNPELVARVAELSARHRAPLTMHLAESIEEIELLASHCGPLVDQLTDLEAWDPSAVPRGIRPLDYLQLLSAAERALVVHGNFLDREEIAYLADRRDTMSLVYCPRTHAYFNHGRYPLSTWLDAGVNLCLGTDSRASNPDLDLLAELRFVAERHGDVEPRAVLEMATLAGARALGMGALAGSLAVGKPADLAIVQLPERETADPHELLFDPDSRVVGVYCAGRHVA
jgi:cytosine/adenosine deaminase-related metal-dependent hydrolase